LARPPRNCWGLSRTGFSLSLCLCDRHRKPEMLKPILLGSRNELYSCHVQRSGPRSFSESAECGHARRGHGHGFRGESRVRRHPRAVCAHGGGPHRGGAVPHARLRHRAGLFIVINRNTPRKNSGRGAWHYGGANFGSARRASASYLAWRATGARRRPGIARQANLKKIYHRGHRGHKEKTEEKFQFKFSSAPLWLLRVRSDGALQHVGVIEIQDDAFFFGRDFDDFRGVRPDHGACAFVGRRSEQFAKQRA